MQFGAKELELLPALQRWLNFIALVENFYAFGA